MRPVIKPALRRLWRGPSTLQLGVDQTRAIVLSGLTPAQLAVLDLLDGARSLARVRAEAARAGATAGDVDSLVRMLERAGALDDGDASVPGLTAAEHERLLPDAASLSLVLPAPGAAAAALRRRRATAVRVVGAGRVGTLSAALLAAAGIGRVDVEDTGLVRPEDAVPGGCRPDDVGRPRPAAAARAVARACRGAGPARRSSARADLVLLAPRHLDALEPGEGATFEGAGVPLLVAGVKETTGIVGPLVVPGVSSCLGCLHQHRRERDATWPLLATQLSVARQPGVSPCDVSLAAVVAGFATLQLLSALDGLEGLAGPGKGAALPGLEPASPGPESALASQEPTGAPLPATLGGTIELTLPDWRVRRRSWPVHPRCSCLTSRLLRDTA